MFNRKKVKYSRYMILDGLFINPLLKYIIHGQNICYVKIISFPYLESIFQEAGDAGGEITVLGIFFNTS